MPIIRWNPWGPMFDDMDEFLGSRLPAMPGGAQMKTFIPAMDMYETERAVMVETPLAGVRPEDVEVSVQKGVLTVKGQTKKEHEVDEKNYYRKEIHAGSFYREVALPAPVMEDKVSAEFEDGILKIICPKAQPTPQKKIAVKVVKKNEKK